MSINPETESLDQVFLKDFVDPEFQKELRLQAPRHEIKTQIINRRSEMGITQKELAKNAGTYQSRISKIEAGLYDLRLSTMVKIAEALNSRLSIRFLSIESTQTIDDYFSTSLEVYNKFFEKGLHVSGSHFYPSSRRRPEDKINIYGLPNMFTVKVLPDKEETTTEIQSLSISKLQEEII